MMKKVNLNLIRDKRLEKGLTQEKMAEKLMILQGAYSLSERGYRKFKASELPKLAEILGLTLEDLFI